MSEKKLESN